MTAVDDDMTMTEARVRKRVQSSAIIKEEKGTITLQNQYLLYA